MKKNKLVFVYPKDASFISIEREILTQKYQLIENTYDWTKKKLVPVYLLHQFFAMLFTIPFSKGVLVSFGGYWALFPIIIANLFKKPSYIVLHGTDCAYFPQISYGILGIKNIRKFCELSYQKVSKILPVSESLVYIENTYFDKNQVIKQGYQHFFPSIQTPYEVIYNGIDLSKWGQLPSIEKEKNTFVTVFSEGQFMLKGGPIIMGLAEKYTQYQFYFVGILENEYNPKNLKNVHFLGRKTPIELRAIYSKAAYYFQLSISEGFGCALCEAMLCECIPIGSNVNMIPQIIGDTGFILKNQTIEEANQLISTLEYNSLLGEKARKQIIDNFSIEHRAEKLLKIV